MPPLAKALRRRASPPTRAGDPAPPRGVASISATAPTSQRGLRRVNKHDVTQARQYVALIRAVGLQVEGLHPNQREHRNKIGISRSRAGSVLPGTREVVDDDRPDVPFPFVGLADIGGAHRRRASEPTKERRQRASDCLGAVGSTDENKPIASGVKRPSTVDALLASMNALTN